MEEYITFIKAKLEDAEAITNLLTRVYQSELETVFRGKEEALFIPGHAVVDTQRYRMRNGGLYKIMDLDQMAGIVRVDVSQREHGRLDLLYILQEFQGKGIGSKAIQFIEKEYPEVKVWQTDTTIHSPRNHYFYEKNGYVLEGEDETDRYYGKMIGEVDLNQENYHTSQNYEKHNFRDSNYSETDWYDINMHQSRFENMNLSDTEFANVSLYGAHFTNTNLSRFVIGDTRINDAELRDSNVSNLHVHDLNQDHNKETSFHFERCVMEESSMEDCNLKGSQITHCNLNDLQITQCNLKGLAIQQCELEGATIDGISLEELLTCYKEKH